MLFLTTSTVLPSLRITGGQLLVEFILPPQPIVIHHASATAIYERLFISQDLGEKARGAAVRPEIHVLFREIIEASAEMLHVLEELAAPADHEISSGFNA